MPAERTMRQRVEAGIALLDEHVGPAWVWDIDLATLDLGSPCQCVLGQRYGLFAVGVDTLHLWGRSSRDGFDDVNRRYRRLTWLWRKRIAELREERARG